MQPLPDALREQVEREGLSLEELAARIGVSPSELAKTYELTQVPFAPSKPAEDEPSA